MAGRSVMLFECTGVLSAEALQDFIAKVRVAEKRIHHTLIE